MTREVDELSISQTDVAVIGMAGRFPGAHNVQEFWHNLSEGIESIVFFTDRELLDLGVDPTLLSHPNYVKAGAPLEGVDLFDAGFFGIKSTEALIMDPQHRIFLECAWEALENSGYCADRYDGSIAVYAGSNSSTYLAKVRANHLIHTMMGDFLSIMANDKDYLTTRVSYKLNLKGPSVAVQTACSTSLVAVHLACQGLISGECEIALAGGVGISALKPTGYLHEQGGIYSPDGHCRAFDATAAGTVSGSGVGLVVLKVLRQALADRDLIHAVIKGSAINNDGHRKVSYTAPSIEGQAKAISEALAVGDVNPETVTYVEAHGTGTPLGDPIEIAALTEAFRAHTQRTKFCAVGSVKSNIGHLTAAAGVASLIKTVNALKHKVIPPSHYFESPNPHIDFQASPFFVSKHGLAWRPDQMPRRAIVSSLGIGGTNAHVVLEESPTVEKSGPSRSWQLLTLSAKTPPALEVMTMNLIRHLEEDSTDSLPDIAYTLQVGRASFDQRRVAVCRDKADAIRALRNPSVENTCTGSRRGKTAEIAFLFPGGGAQYVQMALGLYEAEASFRDDADHCFEIVRPLVAFDLRKVLYPGPEHIDASEEILTTATGAHVALYIVEYCVANFLMRLGLRPAMLIGHSMGEYPAATVAGVFSLEDAIRLVVARGKLMESIPRGAMLVVPVSEAEITPLLSDSVALAAVNAPTSCVISGPTPDVLTIEDELRRRSIECHHLRFSHASHSAMMEPIAAEFADAVREARPRPALLPLIANVTGTWMTGEDAADPQYWTSHLRHTVRFKEGLREILSDGDRVLIEVGPGHTISKLVKRQGPQFATRSVLRTLAAPDEDIGDMQMITKSLGQCWLRGCYVNWDAYYAGEHRGRVSLPTYPFERSRYWIDEPTGDVVDSKSYAEANPSARRPEVLLLSGRAAMDKKADQESTIRSEAPTSCSRGLELSLAPRTSMIEECLVKIVADLFGFAAHEIDVCSSFLELGADSLLLMRVSRCVEDEFGIMIPFRALMTELPSIHAIAEHLTSTLPNGLQNDEVPGSLVSQPMTTPRIAQPEAPSQSLTALEHIVTEQLRVMSRQLEQLREAPRSAAEALSPAPMSQVKLGTRPARRATDPATEHRPKAAAFGPFRPIQLEVTSRMTAQQVEHLGKVVHEYTNRTKGSKRDAELYRNYLADPRAAAGFQLAWKDMIYPIVGRRSQGSKLWDIDGNEYVDFTMGFGVHLFGHSPDFLVRALKRQLENGIQIGPQSEVAGRVAQLISEITGMDRVAFCNSGTEAVMGAVRMARAVTGRAKLVMFTGSYHGTFDGVLARARKVRGISETTSVGPGTPLNMIDDVLVLEYGDPESLNTIRKHAQEVAAVLVEPVQSRNLELQPQEFLAELRQITAREHIALLFDEIITGFRVHPAGAQGYFGITADLAAYGKVLGGGMPIGVVAGRSEYLDTVDGGQWSYGDASCPTKAQIVYAGTFSKNPLAMAAAEAILTKVREAGPQLQAKLNARTTEMVRTLSDVLAKERMPIKISHFGSLLRFTREPDARWLDLLFYHVLNHGIYIWEGRGCFLSTAHSDADIQAFVDALSAAVGALQEGGFASATQANLVSTSQPPQPEKCSGYEIVPLTAGLRQLWVHTQFSRGASLAYHELLAARMQGALDTASMNRALRQMVDRHEALRSTITANGEYLRIASTMRSEVDVIDVGEQYASRGEAEIRTLLDHESEEPLDPVKGPLFRVRLYRFGALDHLFVLVFHHLIMDGYSADVFMQELAQCYTAAATSQIIDLPHTTRLRDYILSRVDKETNGSLADAEAYWLGKMENAVPMHLPGDGVGLAPSRGDGSRERLVLRGPLYAAFKRMAAKLGVTSFTVLLSAFLALLHRWSGQDDITIGIPLLERSFKGDERMLGHTVDLLPTRSRLTGDPPFHVYTAMINGDLLEATQHEKFGYSNLLETQRFRAANRAPVISTTFNLDPPKDPRDSPVAFGRLKVSNVSYSVRHVKFDLHWNVAESRDGLHLSCDYNSERFTSKTVRRIMEAYQALLKLIVENHSRPISELPTLTSAERSMVVVDWNNTSRSYAGEYCIHDLVAAQAERTPEAVAVAFHGNELTYRALNGRANQLARHLRKLGVGPELRVALLVERGLDMVVGLLGILKAGGAYVPLDSTYPAARIAFMLADSSASFVLTQDDLRSLLPDNSTPVISMDTGWDAISSDSEESIESGAMSLNAAYVIYTSGSSGKPKGVCITHGSLINLVNWHRETYRISSSDRTGQFANMSFDACAWEIWPTLGSGAALYIADRGVASSAVAIPRWLAENKITTTFLPTPLAEAVLAEMWPNTSLRILLTGGDQLRRLPEAELPFELVNHYGPTESTVVSTSHIVQQHTGLPPIGRPIGNVTTYVLDTYGELAPIGVSGELYVGGVGVARGYIGRAALTADRFTPDPFSVLTGVRLYRTGDLVRWRENGELEYLGRTDRQVKIRGFRIELGEVENALIGCEGIIDAALVARPNINGNKQLIAYVATQRALMPDISKLRMQLQRQLPDYMIPTEFIWLNELPCTPNGKVDRKSLWERDERAQGECDSIAPRTEIERIVAEIWRRVLRVERVSVNSNFFELGGDSLVAMRIASQLRDALNIELDIGTLFANATIANLSVVINQCLASSTEVLDGEATEPDLTCNS